MGVKSLRPTWFEDETAAKAAAEPMHGLCLIIKENVLPLSNHPKFEAPHWTVEKVLEEILRDLNL